MLFRSESYDTDGLIEQFVEEYQQSKRLLTDQNNIFTVKLAQLQNVQIVASTMRNLFVYDNKQDELLIISQENISALIPNLHQEKTIKPKSKAASSTQ